MRIAVLGAGKMGISFARSFLKYDLIKPENLLLITRKQDKKEQLQQEFASSDVRVYSELNELNAYLLIIAVKPQDFNFVAGNIPFRIPENAMLLSVMAGITIKKIQQAFQHNAVVRSMPNSPTLLGMGITGYTAAPGIPFAKLIQIERLLNATGRSIYLENEEQLNAVTALSGSGPAYFYYIVDAMIKAGVKMGIEENLSQLFVQQTMLGAYHLINQSDKSLEELIKDVASKGGTTEAALKTFETKQLREILELGICAAENRAKELSEGG